MLSRGDDLALLAGRLLIAALFLPSGFSKLMSFSKFAASLASKGLPYPEVWAVLAVAVEILGPLALMVGIVPRWTALTLLAFTVIVTWTTHRYWIFGGAARQQQHAQFYKNLAIMGGLLLYFACGPGAWSLTRGSGRKA